MSAGFAWTLGFFVLALAILIVVHEFGHYAAARFLNVKILCFSVGFGPPLWKRQIGRDSTEWVVAAFPLGGYVRMLDEREGGVPEDELHRAFNRQSVARRSLIVIAGPFANLFLAVLLYWLLFITGVEELRPILAEPPAGTLAAEAKIGAEETVRSVSDVAIESWSELRWEVLRRTMKRESISLETIDPVRHISFYRLDGTRLNHEAIEGDILQTIGLRPFRPAMPSIIGAVQASSPAGQSGLMPGDKVTAIDDRPVSTWHELSGLIRESAGRQLVLEILRNGTVHEVEVRPVLVDDGKGRQVARIGIAMQDNPNIRRQMFTVLRYSADVAMIRALEKTWDTSWLSLQMIGRMMTGELSVKNISGPVTIADYAGQSARMGISHFLGFLALISVSLGVLNLLPIPVLDGGHLMYHLAEIVKGGPLSERTLDYGQRLGFALLAMLMILALYNDINRLISG